MKTRPQSPLRRWMRLLFFSSVLLALLSGWVWNQAPRWVEAAGRECLRDKGFPQSHVQVESVGLTETQAEDLQLGPDRVASAERVTVRYEPKDLLRWRLDQLVLDRARLELVFTENGLDWSPLLRLAEGNRRHSGGRSPFALVTVRESQLVLSRHDLSLILPVDLVATHAEDNSWSLTGTTRLPGEKDLTFRARITPQRAIAAEVSGALALERLAKTLAGLGLHLPLALQGDAHLEATLQREDDRWLPIVELTGGPATALLSDGRVRVILQGRLNASGVIGDTLDDRLALRGRMDFAGIGVEAPEFGFSFADSSGSIPVAWNVPAEEEGQRPGSVKIPLLHCGPLRIEEVELKPTLRQRSLQMTGVGRMLSTVHLAFAGESQWTKDGPAGTMRAEVQPVLLETIEALQKLPFLKRFRLGGLVEAAGAYSYGPAGTRAQANLRLQDVEMVNRHWDLAARDIDGDLYVDPLALRLPPEPQEIRVRELRLGKLTLTDGFARLRGLEDGKVLVETIRFTWAGGTVSANNVTVDPQAGTTQMEVVFDKVDLGKLLDFASFGRIRGQGTISGKWTIRPVWLPEYNIQFGDGHLVAVSSGWFSAEEKIATALSEQITTNAPGIAGQQELVDRIQRAFGDFEFSTLRIELREQDDGSLKGIVQTSGKGPRDAPVPFGGLTLNINQLDDLLRLLIVVDMQAKEEIEERFRRALRKYGSPTTTPAAPTEASPQRQAEERAIDKYF